jgi:hypothetical protein
MILLTHLDQVPLQQQGVFDRLPIILGTSSHLEKSHLGVQLPSRRIG